MSEQKVGHKSRTIKKSNKQQHNNIKKTQPRNDKTNEIVDLITLFIFLSKQIITSVVQSNQERVSSHTSREIKKSINEYTTIVL